MHNSWKHMPRRRTEIRSCLTAPTTTEEDVMTESGVCVCVCFSSCSCTHTHCARRGIINCPCSAIVNLLANLQGVLKSQPFQGPQYTSPSTPVSFPLPRAEHPRSTWPIPGYMPGGSVLSHIPRAQAQEKSFCQDGNRFDTARDGLRRGDHLDETVLVRPKGPCFTKLPCFASAREIHHDISPTLNLHILNSTPQLPYCDLAAIRV